MKPFPARIVNTDVPACPGSNVTGVSAAKESAKVVVVFRSMPTAFCGDIVTARSTNPLLS